MSAYVQFCRKNKVKYLPTLMQKPIWKMEGSRGGNAFGFEKVHRTVSCEQ